MHFTRRENEKSRASRRVGATQSGAVTIVLQLISFAYLLRELSAVSNL